MTKKWYLSLTVWTNILAAIIGTVAVIAQNIHGGPVIDPAVQGVIATYALALINLLLRWRTGQPLG
jgi:hypothetical protein